MLEKNMYTKLKSALDRSVDSRRMGTRKSVLMSGLEKYGYNGAILLFEKANLSEIKIGDVPVEGWRVAETIQNPAKGSKDGLVICTMKV